MIITKLTVLQYSTRTVHTDRRQPISTKTPVFYPMIYSFLLSDCLLLDVTPSSSPALAIWNDLPVDVTSAPSPITFRKRLKLHLFRLSYLGLVFYINCYSLWSLWQQLVT